MKESKEAHFRRVAAARVNKIIKMMRLLGNCSNPIVYQSTNDQVEQILSTLQDELDTARRRYADTQTGKHKRFSLRAEPEHEVFEFQPALCLICQQVADIVGCRISGCLGREITCQAHTHDFDDWTVPSVDYQFSKSELDRLLIYCEAPEIAWSETTPSDSASTLDLGMSLAQAFLSNGLDH